MRVSTINLFKNEFVTCLKKNFTFKAICVISALILILFFLINSAMNALGIGLLIAAIVALIAIVWFLYVYFRRCKNSSEVEPIINTNRNLYHDSRERNDIQPKKRSDELLDFYSNKIRSRPNGELIDTMLTSWYGNYELLERKHDYIQWLFPNRVIGMNSDAPLLTDVNAKIIRETPEMKKRMKEAFELMLDFFGMKLVGDQFQPASNHMERLRELNTWGNHNFLRISRILSALKECGHDKLMLPWLMFLSHLIYQSGDLSDAQSSFEDYWMNTLDAEDKIKLNKFLEMSYQQN